MQQFLLNIGLPIEFLKIRNVPADHNTFCVDGHLDTSKLPELIDVMASRGSDLTPEVRAEQT